VEFTNGRVDPDVGRLLPDLGSALLSVFAFRMAAMFVLTTSTIARSTGVLPRWFVWLGYVVGLLLLLSATLEAWLALIFPLWLLVLSFLIYRRARSLPRLPAVG
jgi:hypothetical protein